MSKRGLWVRLRGGGIEVSPSSSRCLSGRAGWVGWLEGGEDGLGGFRAFGGWVRGGEDWDGGWFGGQRMLCLYELSFLFMGGSWS